MFDTEYVAVPENQGWALDGTFSVSTSDESEPKLLMKMVLKVPQPL